MGQFFFIKTKTLNLLVENKFHVNKLMTATQSLNLYNIALKYFKNEEDATSFVKEIEEVIDNKVTTQTVVFEKIINADVANLRAELKQDMAKLEVKIAESKNDMIKWFVAFFVTLALLIIGLYIKK